MTARLSQKQLLFIEHYLLLGNATEAANAAGYTGNRQTLGSVGAENLNKPVIRDEIRRRQDEIRYWPAVTLEGKRLALWRIVQVHSEKNPDVAIKAIHELNVMDGDLGESRTKGRGWWIEEVLKQMSG